MPAVRLLTADAPGPLADALLAAGPGTLWFAPDDWCRADWLARLARASGPGRAPSVMTFASWLARMLAPTGTEPARDWQARLVLDAAAARLAGEGRLGSFQSVVGTRGFLDSVAALWRELRTVGAGSAELSDAAGTESAGQLAELFRAAEAGLRERDLADGAAAERAARRAAPPFRERRLALWADAPLSPARLALLDAVAGSADEWNFALWLPPGRAESHPLTLQLAEHCRTRGWPFERHDLSPRSVPHTSSGWAAREWFRPDDAPAPEPPPLLNNVELIEAAGEGGEARLVARRIVRLLSEGVAPDRVVLTGRNLPRDLARVRAALDEYGVPHASREERPLVRSPAVAFLLRAAQAAEDQFPFPEVAAVLRSTYFRPDWPSLAGDPDLPPRAESLLRQIDEPRDRAAYLRGVHLWANDPPALLEDESGEVPARERRQKLAKECEAFLGEFFRLWDGGLIDRERDSPAAYARSLRAFAERLGLDRTADANDRAALAALWEGLATWGGLAGTRVERRRFFALARALALDATLPTAEPTAGRVRVVPVEEAARLECDFLILMGLGEGSFPRSAPPSVLIDDAARGRLGLPGEPARLAADDELFWRLLARPSRGLVLAYPAVDPRGQDLLPSTSLSRLRDLLAADPPALTRQQIRVAGYFEDAPLSAAEFRAQWAVAERERLRTLRRDPTRVVPHLPNGPLPEELIEHLGQAAEAARCRGDRQLFGPYDGLIGTAPVRAYLREKFGPERVFAPTALESYVHCPFQFLLKNVLFLEALDDPTEEIEATRRGAAFHRALARFHALVRDEQASLVATRDLPDALTPLLEAEMDRAVAEYRDRAASPAARMLWELEAQRLKRAVGRYRDYWRQYLESLGDNGTLFPRPWEFELDFGQKPATDAAANPDRPLFPALELGEGDERVRLGGRIDRVDLAEWTEKSSGGGGSAAKSSFVIVDYKTGSSANYPTADIHSFVKLQLAVYAMAVESVILKGRDTRPVGVLYWMLTDPGRPALVSPGQAGKGKVGWPEARARLELIVLDTVKQIREGDFRLQPRADDCGKACPYSQVCRVSAARSLDKVRDGLGRTPG